MGFRLRNLPLGTYFAVKLTKTQKKGDNLMALMDQDMVLTTREAIGYLRISKPTFLKYIRLGRIKAVKAGNGWRVHKSELHRFLKLGEKP
jgi:excisionase family DNA binding protein